MTLEERGIHLLPWQKDVLDSFRHRTDVTRDIASRGRQSGKTYLSYVLTALEASNHEEYIVNPRYDPDNTNVHRIYYWCEGLLQFMDKYFPEYTCRFSLGRVFMNKKPSKLKLLLSALQKGEL